MYGLRAENKSRTCRGMNLNWIVCSQKGATRSKNELCWER